MIKLEIEDYCVNCPEFEVKQVGPDTLYFRDGTKMHTDIKLICEHINRCRSVIEFYRQHPKA